MQSDYDDIDFASAQCPVSGDSIIHVAAWLSEGGKSGDDEADGKNGEDDTAPEKGGDNHTGVGGGDGKPGKANSNANGNTKTGNRAGSNSGSCSNSSSTGQDVLNFALGFGAEVDLQNKKGESPLHVAVKRNHLTMVGRIF
jgi:ankyrin repeat protein